MYLRNLKAIWQLRSTLQFLIDVAPILATFLGWHVVSSRGSPLFPGRHGSRATSWGGQSKKQWKTAIKSHRLKCADIFVCSRCRQILPDEWLSCPCPTSSVRFCQNIHKIVQANEHTHTKQNILVCLVVYWSNKMMWLYYSSMSDLNRDQLTLEYLSTIYVGLHQFKQCLSLYDMFCQMLH